MNIKYSIYWDFIKIGFYGILVFLLVGMLLSIPLCLLWNWLMPHIFGLPTLTLIETFGLSILISLLSPRKIGLGKKNTQNQNIYEDANKQLEDLLQDLSSQFRA